MAVWNVRIFVSNVSMWCENQVVVYC